MSSLYEEFGLDTDIPVTDMSGPNKSLGRVLNTMQAKDQGFEDMGFGASLMQMIMKQTCCLWSKSTSV